MRSEWLHADPTITIDPKGRNSYDFNEELEGHHSFFKDHPEYKTEPIEGPWARFAEEVFSE